MTTRSDGRRNGLPAAARSAGLVEADRTTPNERRTTPHSAVDRGSASLPSAELTGLFTRYREAAARFREAVLVAAGARFDRTASAQAEANLSITRSIFGKWSVEILTELGTVGGARFSDLRRALRGISSDVLSGKLQALERAGLVDRRVGEGRPPPVEYRLTEDGLTVSRLGEPVLLFLRLRQRPTSRKGSFSGTRSCSSGSRTSRSR